VSAYDCFVVWCGFCVDENSSKEAVIYEESEISVLVCVMRSWRALDFV
jgi:hypothetical protein